MKISAVILTKNEEDIIGKCINSVSFCNEIVVIDDNSTDATVSIATSLGVKVYKHSLNNNFSDQRNFALEKITGDWTLFLDADEIITKDLEEEIKITIKKESEYKAYYIKRVDFLWGNKLTHGETGRTKIIRLAKKGSGKWTRAVHEKWRILGKIGCLINPIYHYPHKSLSDFIIHIENYSTIHAKANYDEGKKSAIYKIVFFPFFKFIGNYILRLGFFDGTNGIVHALLMSFHSYLSWSKLWLTQKELMSRKY